MTTITEVHAILGLTGLTARSGQYTLAAERFVRMPLPAVDAAHIGILQRDLESLLEATRTYPEQLAAMQQAVLRNDFPTASRVAAEVGLTEEKLVARGGGIVGAIVAGVVLLVVLGALLESDTPPTPTPGASDAGVG
jgi:hypothetical protein